MSDEPAPIDELELGQLWARYQDSADEAVLGAVPAEWRQIRPREFRRALRELERLRAALREIVALVPDFEQSRLLADERGAEVANALTVGAWRAAQVARRALGELADGEAADNGEPGDELESLEDLFGLSEERGIRTAQLE